MTYQSIGIDFGTTNTVVALGAADGTMRCLNFSTGDTVLDVYRSVLCFLKREQGASFNVETTGGNEAIENFLSSADDLRFIQSIKSHAASRLFEETRVFGVSYRFEDLMASLLSCVKKDSGFDPTSFSGTTVSGRPVAFVGSQPDDDLAMRRYADGYKKAGFGEPMQVYEPVGAAFSYAQRLTEDATILVGDFGGGTSDFSIIRFEQTSDGIKSTPIGYSGLGIAGDRFDYRIIDAVISPNLGKNSQYKSFGKLLDMPKQYYAQFAKWHQLSLLKTPETIRALENLAKSAVNPTQIDALIETIVDDRGFDVYRAVSNVKTQLSSAPEAVLQIKLGDIAIEENITVGDFESWISPDLTAIDNCVGNLLDDSNMAPEDIDGVFLTGGSSFIPSVKRLFENRFGGNKLADGNQFQSVAIGLAMIGMDENKERWRAK